MDITTFGEAFGLGGWVALCSFAAVMVAKGAIVKAVDHAAAVEVERLKAGLAKDLERERSALARELERERQAATSALEKLKIELVTAAEAGLAKDVERERSAFARELERERQAAARELEAFKTELTMAAEMRRQVAAMRTKAVADLMALAEPLQRRIVNRGPLRPESHAEAAAAMHAYFRAVSERAHLFDAETAKELNDYASKSWNDGAALDKGDSDALDRLRDRHAALLTLLRAVLDGRRIGAEGDVGRSDSQ